MYTTVKSTSTAPTHGLLGSGSKVSLWAATSLPALAIDRTSTPVHAYDASRCPAQAPHRVPIMQINLTQSKVQAVRNADWELPPLHSDLLLHSLSKQTAAPHVWTRFAYTCGRLKLGAVQATAISASRDTPTAVAPPLRPSNHASYGAV